MKTLERILIVEDDGLFRRTLVKALNNEGYLVYGAADGNSALEFSISHSFDLIIADVRLPGEIDGIEAAERIKKVKPEQKTIVIIMTGYNDSNARKRAEKAGVYSYLYKPFEIEHLLKDIKKCLSAKN